LVAALLDRYRIERELGAGGMATVYLAHDVRHDRNVALKVLRPELSAILGADRFLTEIKTTANLQHPHILSLFDSGEADGTVFYVMPYVEGETLRDRIKREHQLPIDDAVRIAREVADALEYAHQHGVVHRDIKPENILLHGGHAMVADFGIALAASRVEGGSRMTETGMSLGTPHYMSPEQAMGEREITPKADIYALGCVLYEMLTAEPPFTGASAQAIFARVLTDEPRSLTVQRRTIPPNVEAAVHMALQKLPADRFASAAQFSEALGQTSFAAPLTRAGAAAAAPVTRGRRLRRVAPWALFVIAATMGAYGWLRAKPAPVSRQRISLWTHSVPQGAVSLGLAIAPDGGIVFVDTAGGTQQLWTKERDQLEARALTGTTGALMPVFSPNGDWIAFASEGKLKKVPRLGGSPTKIADTMQMGLPAIAWLDDGTVAYNNSNFQFRTVNQDGGPSRVWPLLDSLGRGAVAMTPLPGGRGVLIGECTGGCSRIELVALDLKSGAVQVLGDEIVKGWHTPMGEVLFVRRDGGVFAAPFDMKKMAFVTAPVPVLDGVSTSAVAAEFAMAPNGTVIYEAGAALGSAVLTELMWLGRDGKATPVDSAWSFAGSTNFTTALSPDGKRLALSIQAGGQSDIWIKQMDKGPLTRLTFSGDNDRPVWTPDGRTILYTSVAPGGKGNQDLHTHRADGTGADQLLLDHRRLIAEVLSTPDTNRWIVRLGTPGSRDIMLWQRGTTELKPLIVDQKASESEPSLSPDGRWLAYVSDEGERPDVYVRPFPNVDAGKWQISRGGGSEPLWAHSGHELFYRDASLNLIAVTVGPGAVFESAEQRTLFSTKAYQSNLISRRVYDIAPDDRRFLFARTVGSSAGAAAGPPNLVRIDNWFTELGAPRRRP